MIKTFTKLRLIMAFLAMLFTSSLMAQQLWYVDADNGNDTLDGTSSTFQGGYVGPFETIQYALSVANDLDTIMVSEGEYFGQLQIDKAITLLGANHGTPGNGTRSGESSIYTDVSDNSTPSGSSNSLMQITVGGVKISGFSLDGDNQNVVSNNDINGADVDLSYGIIILGDISGIEIVNNRIDNFGYGGIEALGNINVPNKNCSFSYNAFNNFGSQSIAITCGNGFYADIMGNHINNADQGIYLYDFSTAGSMPVTISDNIILAKTSGVFLSKLNDNTTDVDVENNTISAAGYASKGFDGISLRNSIGNYNLGVRNNTIINYENGVFLFEVETASKSLASDTFQNCDISVNSISTTMHSHADTISLMSCLLNGSNRTAIEIYADSIETVLSLNNTAITNSLKGVLLAGNAEGLPNNTVFNNITAYYFQLDYANTSIINANPMDARGCVFQGNTGNTGTSAQNFLVEDKIRHYLDDESFAYVRFTDKSIYISSQDGNNYIRRGIESAQDGYDIHVQDVVGFEDLIVDKQLNFYTNGNVQSSSFTVDASNKTVVMNNDFVALDKLSLVSGNLNTTNGLVTVGELLSSPGNGGVTAQNGSYVIGPLAVAIRTTNADTITFPIGTATAARPLIILLDNTTQGSWDLLTVQLMNGSVPSYERVNGISHVSEIHYWNISSKNNLTHDLVRYTGTYSDVGTDDQAGEAATLRLATVDNNTWTNLGGFGTVDNKGVISSTMGNSSINHVVLANAKNGTNKLGKTTVVANFDLDDVCAEQAASFSNSSAALRGSIIRYHWDFGDTSSTTDTSNVENPNFTYTKAGTYTVRLAVLTDSSDVDTVYKSLDVFAKPRVGFTEVIPCFPEACTFTDTSSIESSSSLVSRLWTIDKGSYTSSTAMHSFDSVNSYSAKLVVTSDMGCADSVTKSIYQGDSVKISINPAGPSSICNGDSITLTATSGIQSYLWSTGETTNSIVVKAAGKYKVLGTNSNGCSGQDSTVVNIIPTPVADAGSDESIGYGQYVVLNGSGDGSYLWTPATGINSTTIPNPVCRPTETTTYTLTVTNSFGCIGVDSVTITVVVPAYIEVPNLITPNADGSNDVWDLSQIPDIENCKVSVINRWGKEVYSSTQYAHDWDGSYNGKTLPDGVYIYIIEGSDLFKTLSGPLQIIR